MKRKLLLTLTACATFAFAQAQLGTATDFTVTDLDGVTHNLQNWLDDDKVVIVDASATWCPPCWSLHQSNALKDVYNMYGPNGTDQVRVLFYEADANTTLADLQGLTSGTMGDWLTGTPYPVVNESPITLPGSVYWPQGFPTVSLIRPSDAEIVEDMWNWSFAQMDVAIQAVLATVSVPEFDLLPDVSVFPNPVEDVLNIDLGSSSADIDRIELIDATGRIVNSINITANGVITTDMSSYAPGSYMIRFMSTETVLGTRKVLK